MVSTLAKIINHKSLRYALLLPGLILLFIGWKVPPIIKESFIEEKFSTIIDTIEVIAAGVESCEPVDDCWLSIIAAVEKLDDVYQIYAAAYEYNDNEYILRTSRNYETSIFEPFDYPALVSMIETKDSGKIIIGYTPERQDYRDLHIYFRKIHPHPESEQKALLLAGVSKDSIATPVFAWVNAGVAFVILLAAVPMVWEICTIVLVTRIRGARRGKPDMFWEGEDCDA